MKKVTLRITEELCNQIKKDLSRPHKFAYERVGFVIGNSKTISENEDIICLSEYITIDDDHYIKDESVGARINEDAIRNAMQIAMNRKCSIFHVHVHYGEEIPEFSLTDLDELPNIADAMVNANSSNVHGVLLLSSNGANAILRIKKSKGNVQLKKIAVVGYPISFNQHFFKSALFDEDRYDRQSFLGIDAQKRLNKIKVGVVGLGGGGSHIIQQLAHLGVQNYVIFDDDYVSNSNLNRLIGATIEDVKNQTQKTKVASRLIKGLQPNANITIINDKWEERPDLLQSCDVVFGAVDSFASRRDLELVCRRYLMPYIDIGMDVRIIENQNPRMYGQVILSMPGSPCMKCMGFLTEENLALEAAKYGDAGSKPQVVWANGVLSSNAIGLFTDLITGWSEKKGCIVYQEYDGNKLTMNKSYRLDYLKNKECKHFPLAEVGPINWS
ncbi:MAG: ThiF family adenylyltransferase [Allomuricauda sp.]|jgi:ThiF family